MEDRALSDIPAYTALTTMRSRRAHLAVVCDRDQHTLGLITLNDILDRLTWQRA